MYTYKMKKSSQTNKLQSDRGWVNNYDCKQTPICNNGVVSLYIGHSGNMRGVDIYCNHNDNCQEVKMSGTFIRKYCKNNTT